VKPGIRFIENADSYADGAVTSVADPELKTLFGVDIPFIDTGVIGDGFPLIEPTCISRTYFSPYLSHGFSIP